MRNILFAVLMLVSLSARADLPDEALPDPALEARAKEISANLRCMVCDGQSIEDSGAALAGDLRRLVREKLKAGATDDEIYGFAQEKYGDAVLFLPPKTARTALLWIAPLAFFFCGLGVIAVYIRRGEA